MTTDDVPDAEDLIVPDDPLLSQVIKDARERYEELRLLDAQCVFDESLPLAKRVAHKVDIYLLEDMIAKLIVLSRSQSNRAKGPRIKLDMDLLRETGVDIHAGTVTEAVVAVRSAYIAVGREAPADWNLRRRIEEERGKLD